MIRSVFLHVVIPGQEPGAKDLSKDFSFPTMHQLGIGLVTILDQLRIARSLVASRNCQNKFPPPVSWDWAMEQEQTSSPGKTDPGNRREFQVRNDAPDPRAWNSDGEQHSHRKPGKVH